MAEAAEVRETDALCATTLPLPLRVFKAVEKVDNADCRLVSAVTLLCVLAVLVLTCAWRA